MDNIKVSQLLEKIIEIAETHKDLELKKWAHLELEGYHTENKYLDDTDVVPKYRELVGEHRDVYKRPLVFTDPKMSFVNTTRLKNSVIELERLSRTSGNLLYIRDPVMRDAIKKELNVEVYEFAFSVASLDGVLNAIKEEAIRRMEKYISRKELLSKKHTEDSRSPMGNCRGVLIGILIPFALLVVAFLALYFNMRPLITCNLPYYDLNEQKIICPIENKKSNNVGEARVSLIVLSTNEEKGKTDVITMSDRKIRIMLYPNNPIGIPVAINLSKIKDHFHLLMLVESSFLKIKNIDKQVFYWDKEVGHQFVIQDIKNKKYSEIFKRFFTLLRKQR